MEGEKLHIVMLPWLAFGHMTPFMELSKYLARKGHRISFLSTPRNIDRLPKLPSDLAPLVDLVRLPRPHVDGLPDDVEATTDLPDESLRPYLSHVLDGLEEHLASFLTNTTSRLISLPDWIVHDYAPYWAPRVADKFGIPCVYLNVFSAALNTFLGPPEVLMGRRRRREDRTVPPEWVPFSSTVSFRPVELRQLLSSRKSIPTTDPTTSSRRRHVTDTYRAGSSVEGCHVVAVRSCTEFEPEYLTLLQELYRPKSVLPVGFFPPLLGGSDVDEEEIATRTIFDWLEQQAPTSVVYVAFGTEARLRSEQVREIAGGLELSGFPFLWVLRGCSLEMLPEGFEGRTRGRGIVWTGWVPQSRILSHPSIGGFLTHCGWSSIVEGLRCGLPLALLPLMFDQPLNARLLVEKAAGVEVPRNEKDNSFTGADIADTLTLVMAGPGGENVRARAKELKGVFGDMELQDDYVTGFVEYLQRQRRSQSVGTWSFADDLSVDC